MAIAAMSEFTLLTLDVHRGRLLKELQKFGGAQFRPVPEGDLAEIDFLQRLSSQESVGACEGEIQKIKTALGVLRPYYHAPKGLKAMTVPPPSLRFEEFDAYIEQYNYRLVCESIRVKAEELAALAAERSRLTAERAMLLGWSGLDVSTPALNSLKTVKHMMGTVGKAVAEKFLSDFTRRFPASWAECEGRTKEDAYVLCLIHVDDYEEAGAYLKDAGFSRVSLTFDDTAARLLEVNQAAMDQAGTRERTVRESLGAYVPEYEKLSIALDYFRSALCRQQAMEHFLKLTNVVMIRGWVQTESMDAMRRCLVRACGDDWYMEEQPAERDSADVPIQLKNRKLVSAFEGVTSMFALPRYNELDPTPLMAPFYMLFFGLMVGDVGYGLLLSAGTLFALRVLNLKPGTRKFMRFFFWLGLSTIVGGLLYGGAFGVTVFAPLRAPDWTPEDPKYKAILDANYDIALMMLLSVAIGVVQVLFGFFIKAYVLLRDGKILDAVFDALLWILATVSGILLVVGAAGITMPGFVGAASMWVFIGSMAGLFATQGRDAPGIGGKIGNGFLGAYGISGVLGDLISYTRLTALALSGTYIAFSFNMMAGLIPSPVVRVIAGGLIIVAGQTLNLGLSSLGGYVHTCRLQYVEFFGKFYEGGGKPFQPLTLQSDYVVITELNL